MNRSFSKVARITLLFWLMKIVATTLGETLGDYISMTLNFGYRTALEILLCFFLLLLSLQIALKRFIPVIYWLVIVSTTTLGTEISDFMDRSLHLGYAGGSIILIALLLATLLTWYFRYGSLQVYPVVERQKEIFYWMAVLFSNSLGTAFGDLLGDDFGLTYLQGAIVTSAVILVVVILHYVSKINHVILFWIAFVFTRPFGATFGDFLTKPTTMGGLELGTLASTLVASAIILILIVITHYNERKERLKI